MVDRPLRLPIALVAIAVALMVSFPARAILPPGSESGVIGPSPGLLPPPFIVQASGDRELNASFAGQDPAFAGFRASAGGEWWASYDRRTARPVMIQGSGLPWLPGRGNALDARTEGLAGAGPAEVRALLDHRARGLMAEHPGLFRIPAGVDLKLDAFRTASLDGGRIELITYGVSVDGVPVDRASVFFRVSSGNLVQLGSAFLADSLATAPTVPALTAADALATARERIAALLAGAGAPAADSSGAGELLDAGSLHLVPWSDSPRSYEGPIGEGLRYRLAWRVSFRLAGRLETWESLIDAASGEVLALHDANDYACPPPTIPQGRVTGGVYLGPIEAVPESLRGMPNALVTNGASLTTDYNGLYPHDGAAPASTALSGTYFDMNCSGCVNPMQAYVENQAGGTLDLGFGGPDATGNGRSTRAERNCFYHLGVVRQLASKHLDDAAVNGFFSRLTPGVVNIAASCNAFWNGDSVNFYRSSGACNNTGEIADVMQHEWGHGLDQFTGNAGDGARGEGLADVVAFLSVHDSHLGPYFFRGDPSGIRDADELTSPMGLMTLGNVAGNCPGGNGPMGGEVHCEGQVFSQTFWHLARNLRNEAIARGGSDAAGWFAAERLFFLSLPPSDTYVPNQAGSAYDAVVLVDDDDGNLANGTPNGTAIADAFTHHEIASTPVRGDSADCAPPAAPTITLTPRTNPATNLWQVQVDWTAVPGAVQYCVYRNDQGGLGADVPVATVFAPTRTFLDDNVLDGTTYYYRVTAFTAAGCFSIGENRMSVTTGAMIHVSFTNAVVDDAAGNANGLPDRGEQITLIVNVGNSGPAAATSVVGTLTSAQPGVTIVDGSADFGDIPAGGAAVSQPPHFVVRLGPGLACGSVVDFALSLDAVEGCVAETVQLVIGCEAPEPRPRLDHVGVVIGDSPALGGVGNGNGAIDPGEIVRLPMDLLNFGNRSALVVRGQLALVSGPAGLVVGDASAWWPDIAVSATERSGTDTPAHFALVVPVSAACGDPILLRLTVDYAGPSASYTLVRDVALDVGRDVETDIFFDDFEGGDNGFTHGTNCGPCDPQDDWQRLPPTGVGGWDPIAAWSGANIWGNDLGGLIGGANGNGLYRPDVDNFLQSPSIDCTGRTGILLGFRRWLSVEDGVYDRARILVGGTQAWRNPPGDGDDHVLDQEWTYQELDISGLADNQVVDIRFEMKSDGGLEFGGWNIDDLRVFTRERQCSPVVPPSTETDCADGNDEDRDGRIDCADADCVLQCPEANCADGIDNDGDGRTDCADADCALRCPEANCADGIDNDGDGRTDCADADCALRCPEANCADGIDNDGDGRTDCADADCALRCPEADCADGVDNDGDGRTDCADADCALRCPEANCADGVDNDGDGRTDCADADCALRCPEANCADGVDNDGDGRTDCADADCALRCPEANCADGVDNDGDGRTDCADADCARQCPEVNCGDGVDNDTDGSTDCADADCAGSAGCEIGNCADRSDNDGDGAVDCRDSDCAGSSDCAPRLAVNRQAVLTGAGTLPAVSALFGVACSAPQFTLCTDGPTDAIVDGALAGLRLAGEGLAAGRRLWLYEHSDAVATMKIRREGADLVFASN